MRIAALLLAFSAAAAAGDLRVGTAAVEITPPKGAPMAGYYFNRAADGVHDPLMAKALVFEKDGAKAAVVACDLIGLPRPVVEQARALVAKNTGIPGERVMISATHAHTGPVILTAGSRYNLSGDMLRISTEYAANLPAMIADAVARANAALAPARLSAAVGREDSLTFNRRFHMKDGTVGWNPGKRNPNIVRPAGPIDSDVGVLYFQAPDSGPRAVLVNYALHLDTVGGLEFSADYPYTLSKLLAAAKAPDLLTVFTIGCAGNLNHIDVTSAEPQKGHGEAARIGTVLAGQVLKTLKKVEPAADGELRAGSEIVRLPLPPFTPADLEWARRVTPTFGSQKPAPFMDLVRAFRIAEVSERDGRPVEAEVQVIALGPDVAWVGLPGEIFTELGMAIKKASPYRFTIVTELANGSIGYVPNRKAYAEGNYEPESARCAAGSGEMLVDAATRLLVAAHAQK